MIPKIRRIANKLLIKAMTGGRCEYCGAPAHGQPHHIITVGSRGPDIRENLIQLSCGNGCHDKAHRRLIPRDVLFVIVARREGKTVEQVIDIVQKAWRFGEYEIR